MLAEGLDYTSDMAAGYFTDGGPLGMKNGDLLFAVTASTAGSTIFSLTLGILVTTGTTGAFSYGLGGCKYPA
jgi:hypothetical protein